MNSIRHLIVAGSLLCASLVPSAAHAVTTASTASPESPANAALAAGTNASRRSEAHPGAPLSSGLLALGSATDAPKPRTAGGQSQDASLAQREQAAPELRDFRGGRVYLYLGGGATLLLVLLLVLILL